MQNNQPYNTTFLNLIYNAYGPVLVTTKKTVNDIIECEISRVNTLFSKNIYFIIAGLGVLSFSTVFLVVFLLKIDKYLNGIWEVLRKRLRANYPQLKSYLSDRLVTMHNCNIETDTNEHVHKKHIQTLKYKHSLRYFLRLIVLFVTVGVFYLVISLYFYENIKNSLHYRHLFVSALSSRRVALSEIQFLVTESYISSNYSLQLELYIFNPNPTPRVALTNTLNELSKSKKKINMPLLQDFLSKELHDYIFVWIYSVPTFMSTGTSSALRYIIQESLNIVYNKNCTFDDLEKFINEVKEYCDFTNTYKNLPDENSKEYITGIMNKLTYYVVGFYVCLVIIYFGLYFPYFTREINAVKNVVKILLKLPNQK